MLTIELPFRTPSQNQWQNWHFGKRSAWKEQVKQRIKQDLQGRGIATVRPTERQRVVITRYSPSRLDKGNLIGGCKGLLDAIVQVGLLIDDNETWLHDVYRQEKAPANVRRTVVQICDDDLSMWADDRRGDIKQMTRQVPLYIPNRVTQGL